MTASPAHIGNWEAVKPLALRLLLLLLLAVDWATDPFHGSSWQSHALASTEVHCHSLQRQAEITQVCAEAPWLCPPGQSALVPFFIPSPSPPGPVDPSGHGNPCLYVFMSIQRGFSRTL
jgi:hypothetical protein